MERDNRKLDEEIAYMKQQFNKMDRETPLPDTLSGEYLLRKMKEQKTSAEKMPAKGQGKVVFWPKILPLAACFALVLGIFLTYDKLAAPTEDSVVQSEEALMMASPGAGTLKEEGAMEESAPLAMKMAAPQGQDSKAAAFTSYQAVEEKLAAAPAASAMLKSAPVQEETAVEAAAQKSLKEEGMAMEDSGRPRVSFSPQKAVLLGVSDEKRQVSVVQGEEGLELYVLEKEKDSVPQVELVSPLNRAQNLYLEGDSLVVVGNENTAGVPQTLAIQYSLSPDNPPEVAGVYSQTGENIASCYHDDTLYLISSYHAVGADGQVEFPEYSQFEEAEKIPLKPEEIYYKEDVQSDTFTVISAISDTENGYEYTVEACLGDQVQVVVDDMVFYNVSLEESPQFSVDVYETEISFE